MTLLELSDEYEKSADLLRKRLAELRRLKKSASDPEERWHIERRIQQLTPMLTDMNRLAELTRHYYDRGHYRSEIFTVNGIRCGLEKRTSKKGVTEDYIGTVDGIPTGYAVGSCSPRCATGRVRKNKGRKQKHRQPDPAPGPGEGQEVQPVLMTEQMVESLYDLLETVEI